VGREYRDVVEATSEFRAAVDAIDRGDAAALRDLLAAYPELAVERAVGEAGYFARPYLLWFVAENPIRRGRLADGILDVTRVLLDAVRASAGGVAEQADYALALVASGRVPRESGFQRALIDLLVDAGADPDAAVLAAAAHLEIDAVRHLARRGARETVLVAATIGTAGDVIRVAPSSVPAERQPALMVAACLGRADVIRALVAAGVEVSAYGPAGAHSHTTPLHQAARAGHAEAVAALVEAGARRDLRDLVHDGTPAGWAAYGGHDSIAERLRAT
jgi:hypothetical protein